MTVRQDDLIVHRGRHRPSLRAIARKAGVSHTAVAMALRDDPRLTRELRQHIQQVARQQGYIAGSPNLAGTIGVVVPQLSSAFVSLLVHGMVQELWQIGCVPLVLCSNLDVKQEEQSLWALASKRVDGVIIMPAREDRDREHFAQLLQLHTPIVAVNNQLPRIKAPRVAADDDLGGRMVTQHLIERGHRHILHVSSSFDNPFANRERELAYVRVMREAGLSPEVMHTASRAARMDELVPQLEQYLSTARGRQTTAIFAFNDTRASCVYVAARKAGRVIGRDLALVGYGHETGMSEQVPSLQSVLHPSLSTVEQYPARIGRQAVTVLERMIEGKPVPGETLIKPRLLVHESSQWRLT